MIYYIIICCYLLQGYNNGQKCKEKRSSETILFFRHATPR